MGGARRPARGWFAPGVRLLLRQRAGVGSSDAGSPGCVRVLDTQGSRTLGVPDARGPGYAEHLALVWPGLATELTGSSEQAAAGRAECAAGTVSTQSF